MNLYEAAIAAATVDLRRAVHETATNSGPVITAMLKNAGVNEAAPWCAAAVQDWTDSAAASVGVPNPLDAVKLEAFVQSYYEWARDNGKLVPVAEAVEPGQLVLYHFGDARWDHIGLVKLAPLSFNEGTEFKAIEGNTNAEGGREGNAVALKTRHIVKGKVCFVAWA